MTRKSFAAVSVGEVLPERVFPVQRINLIQYAGASGDANIIHWNERIATAVGLPNVIAHGMFTMAEAGRMVTDWAGDPGALLEYGVRFSRPVVVPDDDKGALLTVTATVEALDADASTATVNITATVDGDKVLSGARAVVRLG
ncbi:MAG TPA: MaoC/PaaZ C-terminal domain-containing protein [Mycobacteriales bacterium]|jgi:acyl dehydratase|nr:MaoC/PaaZ C-terminal domain-containing protein [Mycobacteriales bacterium]